MKKRILVIGLCLLVISLVLVSACGGSDKTTTKTATTTATSTATATQTATATATQTATQTATSTHTTTATPTQTQPPTTTAGGSSLADILGQGAAINSIRYDMTITSPMMETMVTTVWEKQQKTREEMTIQGTTTIIIFDMDAGVYYMSSGENMWMKMTLDTSMVPEGATENPNDILDYNPQITGTETIDGKSCTVITWEIPGTGTMTEWIWTEKGFPLKMETTTSEGTTIITFTNISFSDIDDSMFELPEGAIVTTIGA